jgi:deazaflavin-dependent oxidoreductase (nitroreductase family)
VEREKMKFIFRWFLAVHAGLYRLTNGMLGGRMGPNKVLLLNTTGRKSGKTHTTPLGFFEWQDGYVIVASNGGAAANPGWYYNLKNNPQATIQLFDKVVPVKAEILGGEARTSAWQKVITTSPGYANYEKKTTREIPLFLLRAK